jgi:hypothetical protein
MKVVPGLYCYLKWAFTHQNNSFVFILSLSVLIQSITGLIRELPNLVDSLLKFLTAI